MPTGTEEDIIARIEVRNVSKEIRRPRVTMLANKAAVPRPTRVGRKEPFAMRDIELVVPDGMTVAILGPSGCGKTTLLRLIAGLEKPDSGRILYDGVDMAEVPTGDRGVGMVFQDYALYPNLSTDENVLAKYRFQKKTPELDTEAQEKFQRTCDLMGVELTDLLGRFPDHLSGGEKQRVAIARCITRDPSVFLMDEPFSNLDLQMRVLYRLKLRQLLQHFGITTIYVTHDQLEARVLADLIAIMQDGRILQMGTYQQLYEHPQTVFVAEFLNIDPATVSINLLDGTDLREDLRDKVVGVRPEDVVTTSAPFTDSLEGTVTAVTDDPLEDRIVVHVDVNHTEIQISSRDGAVLAPGTAVGLEFERFHVFDRESGVRETTKPGPLFQR